MKLIKQGPKMRFLIIPFLVGVFSLNFLMVSSEPPQVDLVEFENSIGQISRVVQLDGERRLVQRKIFQIIDRFNPEMTTETKRGIANTIYEMTFKYPNLDVDLICATITHESGRAWDPNAVSNAGAMGLMQLMPRTAKWLAKYEDINWTNDRDILFNPTFNIRMGCRYLSALVETYDVEGGLAAYNGGEKIVRKWLASNKADGILWDETSNYVPHVLKLYNEFKSYTL